MAVETITQIRVNNPSVTLVGSDLMLVDQTNRTSAATLAEVAAFVRPSVATTTEAGTMSPEDKAKLNGISSGANANSPDSFLLARQNHTGQSPIASITNLSTRLQNLSDSIAMASGAGDAVNILAVTVAGHTGDITGLKTRATTLETDVSTAKTDITGLKTRATTLETDVSTAKTDITGLKTAPTTIVFPTYTFATLPSASANNRGVVECSDASGGPKVVQSNGTKWLILNTATEVSV